MRLPLQFLLLSLTAAGPGIAAAPAAPKLDPAGFDHSTAACDDFYQHANGGWLRDNPVPDAYSSWGVFNELAESHNEVLRRLLDSAAASKAARGSKLRKLGDYHAAAMDEARIERAGARPLHKALRRIDRIEDGEDVAQLLIEFASEGNIPLFGFRVQPDLKDSSTNLAYATQGGLGLPDRDYYTREGDDAETLRQQYRAHITRMLGLAGVKADAAKTQADAIVEFETRLAKVALTRVELRDPDKSYRLVSVDEAEKQTPNFPWSKLFAAIGQPTLKQFSMAQPAFFDEINRAFDDTPIETWKAYLRWHLIRQNAAYLSRDFVNAEFDFYGKTLNGAKELRPRWKRVIDQVNGDLGELLGEQFVAEVFPPEAKAQVLAIVQNLQAALKERIQKLDWMGAETKRQALEKFATFTPKIGYPDQWRDYSALVVGRSSYYENVKKAAAFEVRRRYATIGKAVDRGEWSMLPQQVNAYYNPVKNEIAFPAAILQPPFFEPEADAALNYGAIGAVIGHELMHGYDDRGSRFDAQGNLRMWWTETDRSQFNARTDRLVAQFDNFVAIDDLHVNGQLTLGENIADLGGLLVAYDAFQQATANQRLAPIDGLTPTQRFFHAWARAWRRQHTDENLKLRLNTDSHAPAHFRVLGPFSNLAIFHDAFGCQEGDAMVRAVDDRVHIW